MTIWLGWVCFALVWAEAAYIVGMAIRWERLCDKIAGQRDAWKDLYNRRYNAPWN